MTVSTAPLSHHLPGRKSARRWSLVLVVEALLVFAYFSLTDTATTGDLRYLLYPFVWINVGLWAVGRTAPQAGSRRYRVLCGSLAGAYLLVTLWVPGAVGLGTTASAVDLRVAMYAPGWGPLVAVDSPWVRLYLVPFEVIGYASLSYLVYAAVLQMSRGVLSGMLGLTTCVGCTVPVLAPLIGFVGGPTTGLSTTAYAWSYDLGTALFVLTVGLLYGSYRRAQ